MLVRAPNSCSRNCFVCLLELRLEASGVFGWLVSANCGTEPGQNARNQRGWLQGCQGIWMGAYRAGTLQ